MSFFFGTATINTLPVVAISTMQMLIAVTCLFVHDRIYDVERLTAV